MAGMVDELKTPIVNSSGAAGSSGVAQNAAATYAAARLLVGTATGDTLYVFGRTTQSDGGQGLFTWVQGGATTVDDGYELQATGGIWRRAERTIRAETFAIDVTGTAASDVALNLAIQQAIAKKLKLELPSGLFKLNAPLLCYSSSTVFSTVQIEGQGGTAVAANVLPSSAVYYANTILYANFTTLPALIYNDSRDCILRNVAIVGQNVAPAGLAAPSSVSANYVTGGCRDSRYSPYCGICVDPFCGGTPADGGYAGFTYPFSGASGGGTHALLVENCDIMQFTVGVMMGPTSGANQGDDFLFHNVNVNTCRIAYAWGQGQARANTIRSGNINQIQCAFDTLTYGAQNGTPPKVYDTQLGTLYNLMSMKAGVGPGLFSGIYAESIMTLGRFASGQTNPLTIVGSQFSFNNQGSPWLLPSVVLECSGPVKFQGCDFRFTSACDAFNFAQSHHRITFDNCTFSGASVPGRLPAIGVISQNTSQGICAELHNCFADNSFGGSLIWISDDSTGRAGSGIATFSSGSRFIGTYQTRFVTDGNLDYVFVPPIVPGGATPDIQVGGGAITAMTVNATTITFSLTNASRYLAVNDILMWQMMPQFGLGLKYDIPALKITSIAGSSVTATMLFDPAEYDTVGNFVGNIVFVMPHMWAPTQPLTCTTNGTTSLTTVSPTGTLVVGDFIVGLGANAGDISSAPIARVTATDGAGNVTISLAANGSHAGVGLCFAQLNPQDMNNPVTVANLPGTPRLGMRAIVRDATAPTFGATVAGAGAVVTPVYYDGAAWKVG